MSTAYRISVDASGWSIFGSKVVATFLERELAVEFANLKNGPDTAAPPLYTVSQQGSEFCVSRDDRIAIFFSDATAIEYVNLKLADATAPAMAGPTQAPAPFNYADAWAEGEQMLARAGRIE
jgi:hypothetical protein